MRAAVQQQAVWRLLLSHLRSGASQATKVRTRTSQQYKLPSFLSLSVRAVPNALAVCCRYETLTMSVSVGQRSSLALCLDRLHAVNVRVLDRGRQSDAHSVTIATAAVTTTPAIGHSQQQWQTVQARHFVALFNSTMAVRQEAEGRGRRQQWTAKDGRGGDGRRAGERRWIAGQGANSSPELTYCRTVIQRTLNPLTENVVTNASAANAIPLHSGGQ